MLGASGRGGACLAAAGNAERSRAEALLFAQQGGCRPGPRHKTEPDWAAVHRDPRRPGVTLPLLWEEYGAVHADGYGYGRWCELNRGRESRLSPRMRQTHPAGERLFVD
ncbi:MAG: hypothetical protein ACLGP3_03400 [Acidobacteriota bacterium]